MVIADLFRKRVFLDTAPLIYFIEGHSIYQPVLTKIFDANDRGEFQFVTSCITLLEVLVKPLQSGQTGLANQYKYILANAPGINIYDITTDISISAAQLRASYNLKTPDALQIAAGWEYKADYFLTNDARLQQVTEIDVIMLQDIA